MQLGQIALADVHHVDRGLPRVVDHGGSPCCALVPVVGKEEQEQGQEHEKAVEEDVEDERHGVRGSSNGGHVEHCAVCLLRNRVKLDICVICQAAVKELFSWKMGCLLAVSMPTYSVRITLQLTTFTRTISLSQIQQTILID